MRLEVIYARMQSAVYVQLYSTNRDTALVYMREKKGLSRSNGRCVILRWVD